MQNIAIIRRHTFLNSTQPTYQPHLPTLRSSRETFLFSYLMLNCSFLLSTNGLTDFIGQKSNGEQSSSSNDQRNIDVIAVPHGRTQFVTTVQSFKDPLVMAPVKIYPMNFSKHWLILHMQWQVFFHRKMRKLSTEKERNNRMLVSNKTQRKRHFKQKSAKPSSCIVWTSDCFHSIVQQLVTPRLFNY